MHLSLSETLPFFFFLPFLFPFLLSSPSLFHQPELLSLPLTCPDSLALVEMKMKGRNYLLEFQRPSPPPRAVGIIAPVRNNYLPEKNCVRSAAQFERQGGNYVTEIF